MEVFLQNEPNIRGAHFQIGAAVSGPNHFYGHEARQDVLNPAPLNPTPATCHKRKTEVALQFSESCAAKVALQHSLLCSAEVVLTKSCAAASEKLQRNIENRQKASIMWCDLFRPKVGPKKPKIITSHDVLEPSKKVLSASRDVMISGQIRGSKLQRVFTLGDGCWLPRKSCVAGEWRFPAAFLWISSSLVGQF